jgi:outer membrane immunogenic protein
MGIGMRRIVRVGVGLLSISGFSGVASAADLGPKPTPVYTVPPMVPPPAPSWTGFYLGIEGGWSWGREDFTDNSDVAIPPGRAISHRPDGGIFGGELGYRYQTGQFVFGAEGTAAWADLHDDVKPIAGITDSFKVRSLYTATGQIGWAFTPLVLLYAKGGWAGSSVNTSIATAVGGFASQTQFDNGWTVGAGLDYAIWQNLVLGVEYDHTDLGFSGFSTVGVLGNTYIVRNPSRLTIEQVVGRLSYKFNIP